MQCRSLQVEDPSHDDSSKINSLLILLNEDEQKLRQYRYSPEGSDLYNQIKIDKHPYGICFRVMKGVGSPN